MIEDTANRKQIQNSLHTISGQLKVKTIVQQEHNYSKPYNTHPDPLIQALPTRYLYTKSNRRNATKNQNVETNIDVITYEEPKKLPFVAAKASPISRMTVDPNEYQFDDLKKTMSFEKASLWSRANILLNEERISRLTLESNPNFMLLKRIKQNETVLGFREMYASVNWQIDLIQWLHCLLCEQLDDDYKLIYSEMLELLKGQVSLDFLFSSILN